MEYAAGYAFPWFWGSSMVVMLVQRFAFKQTWRQVIRSIVGLGWGETPLWFREICIVTVIGGTAGLFLYDHSQCSTV